MHFNLVSILILYQIPRQTLENILLERMCRNDPFTQKGEIEIDIIKK